MDFPNLLDRPTTAKASTPSMPAEEPRPSTPTVIRASTDALVDYAVPVVDEDFLLRFRDRWVALTEMQAPIVDLLLANVGRMVSVDEIRRAYASLGGSTRSDALRSLMHRVARRLIDVGASVSFDRQRSGMMVSLP